MKRYASPFSIVLSLFLFLTLFASSVAAGSLGFDKTTVSVNAGDTFTIGVTVDAGTDAISSVDAYVLYDSSVLQANSVTAGSFFPTVLNDISSTRVYVAGLVDNPTDSKTGTGTIGTLTFQALKSGTITLTYNCGTGTESSQIIKNDINATNVISCSSNGSSTVTVSGGTATSLTPTATPSAGGSINELPQTGILENIIGFAIPGLLLVFLGGGLKFVLARKY